MSRAADSARHERIDQWPAPQVALYIDRGAIMEWPFEVTRHFWRVEEERDYVSNRQTEDPKHDTDPGRHSL